MFKTILPRMNRSTTPWRGRESKEEEGESVSRSSRYLRGPRPDVSKGRMDASFSESAGSTVEAAMQSERVEFFELLPGEHYLPQNVRCSLSGFYSRIDGLIDKTSFRRRRVDSRGGIPDNGRKTRLLTLSGPIRERICLNSVWLPSVNLFSMHLLRGLDTPGSVMNLFNHHYGSPGGE